MDVIEAFEPEPPGGAGGDVDDTRGAPGTLVDVGVHVERRPADLAELEVVVVRQQLPARQAGGRGAVLALPQLDEGDGTMNLH